ncbi:thiamine phosphate synthase [Flavitalea antarctica]
MNHMSIATGGVYLVVNPSLPEQALMNKLKSSLDGGISLVQIWNRWELFARRTELIYKICAVCSAYDVPVLINEDWQLLQELPEIDGIHLDKITLDIHSMKQMINRPFITGITCGNDTSVVEWAIENRLDYISFCSMFPSGSAGACETVTPAIINKTKNMTEIPIFISGGVTPENLLMLAHTIRFDGVAVIGGILSSDDPQQATKAYKEALRKIKENHHK